MRLFLRCQRCRLVRLMDSEATLCDECAENARIHARAEWGETIFAPLAPSEVTQTTAHDPEQTAD